MKNQHGNILITVLIFSGVVVAVMLSLGKTLVPAMKLASTKSTKDTLSAALSNFQQCAKSGQSWYNTVKDTENNVLDCIRDGVPCKNGAQGFVRLHSAQTAPGVAGYCLGYDSLNKDAGVSSKGKPCLGFDKDLNQSCPYHIDVTAKLDCLNASECDIPYVSIVGRIRQRTSPSGVTQKHGQLYSIDFAQLNFGIVRGLNTSEASLVMYETKPKGQHAGPCGNSVPRKFNVINIDSHGYLKGVNPDGSFVFKPGSYNCKFSAPAFLVGSHHIELDGPGLSPTQKIGSVEYSPDIGGWLQNRSVLNIHFNVPVESTFRLIHHCSSIPTEDTDKTLGRAMGLGVEIFSIMSCRISKPSII